jgi:hypothetical protein
MGFLVKGAFWFSVVLLSLPLLDGSESESGLPAAGIEVGETVQALGVAIADLRAICERHPDVCETGGETLTALGLQARDGARLAYEYLDMALGEEAATEIAEAPSTDPRVTGTVTGMAADEAGATASVTGAAAVAPYPAPAR